MLPHDDKETLPESPNASLCEVGASPPAWETAMRSKYCKTSSARRVLGLRGVLGGLWAWGSRGSRQEGLRPGPISKLGVGPIVAKGPPGQACQMIAWLVISSLSFLKSLCLLHIRRFCLNRNLRIGT